MNYKQKCTILLLAVTLFLVPIATANADPSDDCPICPASYAGDILEIKRLIVSGKDVNAISEFGFALEIAAATNQLEAVQLLLEAGADVNLSYGPVGNTALHAAAVGGHARIIQTLLYAGAGTLMLERDGRTALFLAVSNGHTAATEVLLQAGVPATIKMTDGTSLVDIAMRNKHFEVAYLLHSILHPKTE